MPSKRAGGALLALLLSSGAAADSLEDDPAVWLQRAGEAAGRANFVGTLALLRGPEIRTMRIQQGFDGQRLHQRLLSMSGEQCEILRIGEEASVIYPQRRLVFRGRFDAAKLLPQFGDRGALLKHYEASLAGYDRVVERDCRVLEIAPRDRYRYGCEMCVDVATGLPLRLRTRTHAGDVLEQHEFTALHVFDSMRGFSADAFRLYTDTAEFVTVAMPQGEQPPVEHWMVGKLPPGFQVHRSVVRQRPHTPLSVHHMVVGDALGSVSVFITRQAEPRIRPPRPPLAMARAQRAYTTEQDGYQITVVGQAPEETVRMIGESMRRHP